MGDRFIGRSINRIVNRLAELTVPRIFNYNQALIKLAITTSVLPIINKILSSFNIFRKGTKENPIVIPSQAETLYLVDSDYVAPNVIHTEQSTFTELPVITVAPSQISSSIPLNSPPHYESQIYPPVYSAYPNTYTAIITPINSPGAEPLSGGTPIFVSLPAHQPVYVVPQSIPSSSYSPLSNPTSLQFSTTKKAKATTTSKPPNKERPNSEEESYNDSDSEDSDSSDESDGDPEENSDEESGELLDDLLGRKNQTIDANALEANDIEVLGEIQ